MVIIQDIKTWQSSTTQIIYSYIKPSTNNNRYYKCIKYGTTGLNEPSWTTTLGSIINDGTCQWECVEIISSNFDINSLLPEVNQEQPLFLKFREMMTWVLSLNESEFKSITEKYSNFYNLDDIYIREILNESGYGYIADAKVISGDILSNIYGYLKIIHLLKGTRKGLRLVLDLLGYPYTEQLWYEKSPRGEPHTADLTLQMPFESFTNNTLNNLIKFLRFYVYPIVNLLAEIEPFVFHTSQWYGVGVGDYVFDYTFNFEVESIISLIVLQHQYLEGDGIYIFDSSGYDNNSVILPSESSITAVLRHIYRTQVFPIPDITDNNNNSNIIVSLVNSLLFNHIYTENTGTAINDISNLNNDSSIITDLTNFIRLNNRYTENTGTSISDSSGNSNTSNIITDLTNFIRLNNKYTENTGTSISDSSGNSNTSNIISTGSLYPRNEKISALFDFNNNALDSSGNSYNGTLGGGANFISGGILDLGDNASDYLQLPEAILHNKVEFSISTWIKVKGFHTTGVLPYNFFLTASNSGQIDHFGLGYLATVNSFVFMLNNTLELVNNDDLIEDSNFHHICLTRDSNGLITLYVDKNMWFKGLFANNPLNISTGGLIVGQEQDSVGGGFDSNQCGNIQLGNLIFYDIELKQNEINRLFNLGF